MPIHTTKDSDHRSVSQMSTSQLKMHRNIQVDGGRKETAGVMSYKRQLTSIHAVPVEQINDLQRLWD